MWHELSGSSPVQLPVKSKEYPVLIRTEDGYEDYTCMLWDAEFLMWSKNGHFSRFYGWTVLAWFEYPEYSRKGG